MTLTVEIPDHFTVPLHLDGPERSRRALEMLALEGYRSGDLSRGQVSELLALDFFSTEEFLQRHDAGTGDTLEELEHCSATLSASLSR